MIILLASLLKPLRVWDYHAGQQHKTIFANSKTTQQRIQKYYKREAQLLYPPIETGRFQADVRLTPEAKKTLTQDIKRESAPHLGDFDFQNYYIVLSALTEFKRIEVAIDNMRNIPGTQLLIIGKWEHGEELKALASQSNTIYFSWAQYADNLVYLVQNSLGLIFPGEEDFGIVPIEVMAAGKPVFALHKGWLTESVIAWETGDFFYKEDGSDFTEHFHAFHKNNQAGVYLADTCKTQAEKYDISVFKEKIQQAL